MPNTLAISILLLAFFASIVFNGFFSNIAKKNKILIDIPDKSRKFHFNETALTGGLGIFCSILVSGLLLTDFTDAKYSVDLGEKGFLKNSIFNDIFHLHIIGIFRRHFYMSQYYKAIVQIV